VNARLSCPELKAVINGCFRLRAFYWATTDNGEELNQPASANPAACCGVSERNKIRYFPYWEDSLQLAAGSFNSIEGVNWPRPAIFLQPV
jgi:hypothetical protein